MCGPRRRAQRPFRRTRAIPLLLLLAALIASAYLLAVTLASARYPWVAWIALLPIFGAVRALKPVAAMASGGVWGVGFFLFSTGVVPAGIPATAESLLLLTTVPALYALVAAAFTRRLGFNVLFLAAGWVGVEVALRPLNLPNGLLARAQGSETLVRIVGGLLGYGFVAFLVALANAVLLSVVRAVGFSISRARPRDSATGALQWLRVRSSSMPLDRTVRLSRARGPPISATGSPTGSVVGFVFGTRTSAG